LEYSALEYYKHLFSEQCLVAGDWNVGPHVSPLVFQKISQKLSESGLINLYHRHHGLHEAFSEAYTFKYSKGKSRFWIDHIFGSKLFLENTIGFEIGDLDNAILSDHAPLVLDINLDELTQAR
jgi:endonuclease/exonuclease/phosphatase family metal-dependent hydrolase